MQATWAIRTVKVAQNVTLLRSCAAAPPACGQNVANFGPFNSGRNQSITKRAFDVDLKIETVKFE